MKSRTCAAIMVSTVVLAAGCGSTSHTVVVPDAVGKPLPTEYALLHKAGLRVTVSDVHQISALIFPGVRAQRPAAGAVVPVGSSVQVELVALIGSPGYPIGPNVTVANYLGQTPNAAIAWANFHHLYWELTGAPSLHDADATNLFANYVITRQFPAPGAQLRSGIRPTPNSFRPTPLTLWVRQRAG
jgi:hypothetical protein